MGARRSSVPKLGVALRNERRERLLEAAWRCAARRGFRELTIDEICSEAGASKGAFYGYFASKQELQLALLEEDAGSLDRIMAELDVADDRSSLERVRRFARAVLRRSADPARVQVRADLWADMLHRPEVRERFGDTMAVRRSVLRGWIEEGVSSGALGAVPANALAAILLSMTDGLMLHAALDPAAFRWNNVGKALDALLSGLVEEDLIAPGAKVAQAPPPT
jgi:TetR/AcrR family transcriptional regulator, transcriptional repressor of aconitase